MITINDSPNLINTMEDVVHSMPIGIEEFRRRGKEQFPHSQIKELTPTILAELYLELGLSPSQIAKMYKCSPQAILYRLKREAPTTNEQVEDSLKITPTSDLSYVLGVILGDGCVGFYPERHQYPITLGVKSRVFAKKFQHALFNIGLKANLYEYSSGYRVNAHSKRFALWYKSLQLHEIEAWVKNYPKDFIQGFWDSEGCYSGGFPSFSNTNIDLLNVIKNMLSAFGIESRIDKGGKYPRYIASTNGKTYYSRNQCYRLNLQGGRESRKRFITLIDDDVK